MKQMKKSLLYIAWALLATATVGCEEADNGAANDTLPVVTIYDNWEPEDAYDSDVDCPLRIIPNSVAESCYVLPELLADKEAYIAAQGEDAYLQHVIDNGQQFDDTLETVFTDLKGDYVITIVAVAGNLRQAYEYVFNGVVWIPAGKCIFACPLVKNPWYQEIQYSEAKNQYRLPDCWFGEDLHFFFEWDGGATFKPVGTKNSDGLIQVYIGDYDEGIPMYYLCKPTCPYDAEQQIFTINANWYVSGYGNQGLRPTLFQIVEWYEAE